MQEEGDTYGTLFEGEFTATCGRVSKKPFLALQFGGEVDVVLTYIGLYGTDSQSERLTNLYQ